MVETEKSGVLKFSLIVSYVNENEEVIKIQTKINSFGV